MTSTKRKLTTKIVDELKFYDGKPPERVFIWDLDETLIIFQSLLTGEYASKFGKVSLKTKSKYSGHMCSLGMGVWMSFENQSKLCALILGFVITFLIFNQLM